MFRIKEKGVSSEGEQLACVATEFFIATETPGNTSSAISSFFRVELHAIKEKQGQHDLKQDKIITQLANMEELLYFSLIMLKRLTLIELSDPPIPTPAAATATDTSS